MKFTVVLSVICAILMVDGGRFPLNYSKFLKVECSSSQKYCPNITCNIRPARQFSFLNFGCVLTKPLTKFYVDVGYYKKNGPGNYQQIVNLKALDACSIYDNLQNFKFLQPQIDWFNVTFPGLYHKCPFTNFNCYNASLLRDNDRSDYNPAWLPPINGVYKMIFKIYNDDEKNIARLVYHQENQFHFEDQKY